MWEFIKQKWRAEPVIMTNAIIAIIQAVIVLVVSFGVPISEEQSRAIIGVTSAIAVLLGGGTAALVARSRVSPKDKWGARF